MVKENEELLEKVNVFVRLISDISDGLRETVYGKLLRDNILLFCCSEFCLNIISEMEETIFSVFIDGKKIKIISGATESCQICFDIQLHTLDQIIFEEDRIREKNIRLLKYLFKYLGSGKLLNESHFQKELKGENITLRRFKEAELQLILLWYIDKDLNKLAGYAYDEPDIRKIRSNMQSNFGKDPMNLVIEHNQSETPIGTIQLYDINKFDGNCMLGIRIGNRDFQGKGYGREAIELLLKYAFETLKLKRVSLKVYEYNENAIKCYLKTGFEIEGHLRKSARVEDQYFDEVLMSIINQE